MVIAFLLLLMAAVAVGIIFASKARGVRRLQAPQTTGAGTLLWPASWMVIKSRNLGAVQAAFNVRNPRPCSWLEGFANADKIFIAPPVRGWILVTGTGLPEPSQDVDTCFRFIRALSRQLGQVQFFTANRLSHHHAWVQARNGRIVRAYAWSEGTIWNQGPPTWTEVKLGLKTFDYFEGAPGMTEDLAETVATNVKRTPLLAARWGLDLAQIREHLRLEEYGIAGKALPHLR